MIKRIIILSSALLLLSVRTSYSQETKTAGLKLETTQLEALVYYRELDSQTQKILLTNPVKALLEKSLTEIISIFENTERQLTAKQSSLEISEVEIYGALTGEGGVQFVKGSAEASFKIVLKKK